MRAIANRFVLSFVLAAAFAASAWATSNHNADRRLLDRAEDIINQGQEVFRFDTFGDEDFWAGTLRLNEAIEGADHGGVGPGLSPRAALEVGLKVDLQALPPSLVQRIRRGQVNLDDPTVTLDLIALDAVVGVKGRVAGNSLQDVGITCALCHSTVDNSLTYGIGNRLDGFANRDLNVGAIVAFAPNLAPLASLLGVSEDAVREVLLSWGPGKFDAELFFDGKAYNPQQITDGEVTGTNVPGATLIPNAFALPGHNLHTWEGGWGTVTYWNALVANLEMHGKGNFFDARLDDAARFPIAAANGFGHIVTPPDEDLITSKLPALHVYQLVLPAPTPTPGVDYDPAAAARGDELFSGRAGCTGCHKEPIWTEPGWNAHPAADIGIDAFQAQRGPDDTYRTMNLAGIFVRERGLYMSEENKGRYYHDGRFATLMDVVNHYNTHFSLGLSEQDKTDLVEYLKSLGDPILDTRTFAKALPEVGEEETTPATHLTVRGAMAGSHEALATYSLKEAAFVSLRVFDAEGRLVATLVQEPKEPGEYTARWDASSSPNGVYFCRLQVGDHENASKFIVLK